MVSFEVFATGTDQDINADYFAYIRRNSDHHFWDVVQKEFVPFVSLSDGKVTLTENEDQHGVWVGEEDLGEFTGLIAVFPREVNTEFLIPEQVQEYYVRNGKILPDPRVDKTALNTHYQGINSLQLVNDSGEPVSGADILVYRKEDYDVGNTEQVQGVSVTNNRGHWVYPVLVPVGDTYTILYHKEGETEPVTAEITVP